MCSKLGQVIGVFLYSYFTDIFGLKKVLMTAYLSLVGLIFMLVFAPNIQCLMAGILIYNIPIGTFNVLATGYASQLCPVVLRGYLQVFVLLCWTIGELVGFGVVRALANSTSDWGYRIPYAIQWIWPVIMPFIMVFAPESPYWLVRKGKFEEAQKSVSRLMDKSELIDEKDYLAMIIRTVEVEREIAEGTSFLDVFNRKNIRRTEIVFGCWVIQAVTGYVITR
jgi:SP family general alpha glucoside:H+ symporter-like MFS transporter